MTLRSGSRFTGSNPTFTLEARTSGGAPTTSTWTRDDIEITSGISLEVDTDPQESVTDDNMDAYLNSRYISTLFVTGVFPGVYQYSASNRAMASPRTDSFAIEGTSVCVVLAFPYGGTDHVGDMLMLQKKSNRAVKSCHCYKLASSIE